MGAANVCQPRQSRRCGWSVNDLIADIVVLSKNEWMTSEPQPNDQAKSELRELVASLQERLDELQLSGSGMICGCRDILNIWVRGGGSSLHDAVIGFTSIESQTDYVLGGSEAKVGRPVDHVRFEPDSAAERAEVEELNDFFRDQFTRDLDALALFLNDS